jgi:dTMP kinase
MARGRFITMEGVEGVGKSTQLVFLREHLQATGHEVLMTREPGGSDLAEDVRAVLLDPRHAGMTPDAELLLVFAARADHLARRVLPALAAGRWVVSDRFTDATFAYQGGGRGIPPQRIEIIEQWVQGSLRPDRVLLLDLPPALGADRVAVRGTRDRFERESPDFFQRVRNAYLARASAAPQRYRIIDASGTVDQVRARVVHAVADLL